ncbi:hypothetical protein PCANB_001487 [Pneumocystis canis]|nr:hypothetical protein PCANB_001487 [Pneumocystis canis]
MMGVSKFHKLGFQGQATKVIDNIEIMNPKGLWEEKKNHMLITLAGITNAKSFYTRHPLFMIENSPSSEAYNYLIKRILNQFHKLTGSSIENLYANMYGGGLFIVPPIQGIHNFIQHTPSLKLFENQFGEEFSNVFNLQYKEDRCFLSEILSLDSFITALSNNSQKSLSNLMTAHLTSLETLYRHYGIHSAQYTLSMKAINMVLYKISKKLPNITLTVMLLPPTLLIKDPILHRHEIETVFGNDRSAPVLEELKITSSRCYDSKANCEKLTNYCSNHGNCEKYLGQECYICQCFPTVTNITKKGRRVSYWSGDLCQKQDISSEFQMFFWVILFFIIALIYAIKLLYSVGNEELGAILMNMDIPKKI